MTSSWPFGELRPFAYDVILADPPWLFEVWSEAGAAKSPQAQYDCMPTADIAAMPAGHLAGGDCLLFMWATFPMLPDALTVMRAWGFQYKTGLAWAKRSLRDRSWTMGPGFIVRSAAELLLVGTTGQPRTYSKSIRNLIVAPVRGHSRKPAAAHEAIEALTRGRYVELFARQRRAGWDAWGNEVDKFGGVA